MITDLCTHAELKELVTLHGETPDEEAEGDVEKLVSSGELGATLTKDEVNIIKGALDLSSKTVRDAMTPVDKVFMLDVKQTLDMRTVQQVHRVGMLHDRTIIMR